MRKLVDAAARTLEEAGVDSPRRDAELLLAFVLDVPVSRLPLVETISQEQRSRFEALVARRATRQPLQHLTGTAYFRHVELAVGPGVFVPRPETELLAGWAIKQVQDLVSIRSQSDLLDQQVSELLDHRSPVVVDLCTGSGAIAKAIADEVPDARVYAVELDEGAHAWASRNLAGTGVDLRQGDLAEALPELDGLVDVVVCNPPYIPHEAWESVAPEARDHDPHLALYAADEGLAALRLLEERASRLLRAGGVVGAEHADVQGESAPAVFTATGRWAEVRDHEDLAGRPRYVTARLAR